MKCFTYTTLKFSGQFRINPVMPKFSINIKSYLQTFLFLSYLINFLLLVLQSVSPNPPSPPPPPFLTNINAIGIQNDVLLCVIRALYLTHDLKYSPLLFSPLFFFILSAATFIINKKKLDNFFQISQ